MNEWVGARARASRWATGWMGGPRGDYTAASVCPSVAWCPLRRLSTRPTPVFTRALLNPRFLGYVYIFSREAPHFHLYRVHAKKKRSFYSILLCKGFFFRLKWKHVFPLMIQMIFCIKAINKAVVMEFIKIISGTITDMIFNNAVFFFSKSWKR